MRRRRRDGAAEALAGAAAAAAATAALPPDPPPAAVPDPTAAAFFDVDGTLIAGASAYWFARGLAARGLFTTRDLTAFAWKQVRFRLSGKEDLAGMASAQEAALGFVAGRQVADIVGGGEEIFDEVLAGRVFAGTRALAQAHLDAGRRVWLVTATPVELATVIAHRLGLTGALGTVAEVADGRYTGRLVGVPLHGPAKAEAVRALAAAEGLDLGRCSAYSDSRNDLPMLEAVGHPTAVNPDADLRRHARAQGWPVRDFRTGRRVARVGIPVAGGSGALAGAVLAGLAVRRRLAG